MEFDVELEDFKLKSQSLTELPRKDRGDFTVVCMEFSKLVKMNPKIIADRLKPYIEELDCIKSVENASGYLNIYFNKLQFLSSVLQ